MYTLKQQNDPNGQRLHG